MCRSAIEGGAADGAGGVTIRVWLTCRPIPKATRAMITETTRSRGGNGKPCPDGQGVVVIDTDSHVRPPSIVRYSSDGGRPLPFEMTAMPWS